MKHLETLPAGTVKRIHVHRANLLHNRKTGENRPVYSIKNRGKDLHRSLGHRAGTQLSERSGGDAAALLRRAGLDLD